MAVKTKSLFYNIVKVLAFAALVPVLVFGIYMFIIDSRIIQAELFEKQSFMNVSIDNSVRSYFAKKRGLLRSFVRFHDEFFSARPSVPVTKKELSSLREIYPDILAAGYMNSKGDIESHVGDLDLTQGRSGELNAIKYLTLNKGEDYVGVVKETGKTNTMIISIPRIVGGVPKGALIAKFDIHEMITTLEDFLLEGVFYGVFTADGKVVASSSEVTEDILSNFRAARGATSGEFKGKDGRRYLLTTSVVSATGWTIYVQQPSQTWDRILRQNPSSILIVFGMMIGVVMLVLVLSKVAIKPILEPVEKLKESAEIIAQGQFDLPSNLQRPDNEIGELMKVFASMAKALKRRQEEVVKAERELANANAILEKKVEERTRQLSKATDTLVKKERLAAIGELASIISHEIRNPLAVISNSSKLVKALTAADPNPKLEKQFNIIDAEIRQANRIVEEVLGYARDRQQILTGVNLNSYIKEIAFSHPKPENIELKLDLDKKDAKINIDAEEMKQAMRNLLSNAVEVMPTGGVLYVGTKVGKRIVCIYVCDQGAGMGEETLLKIYTPFFTTKARGTGLGLAVVKKAVANNKGKMFVESERDMGTTFKIFLKKA